MDYQFAEIERKWQAYWKHHKTFEVDVDHTRPKFYVLDMFPYPSGAGLHVGHPLGYIASDIYSWYKRLNGFNVLHPMGYDAFGLPAEQYAIQTGQHPAITTAQNIKRYREQLDKIGFSYDWAREVRTCEPSYYKWTQWVFTELFGHWYNTFNNRAESIQVLIGHFSQSGTRGLKAACSADLEFSASEWLQMPETEQQKILLNYRLAYLAETVVNWCPALGTVLANDEVKEGFSVRGGHPVEQRRMKQWFLRVSAYAERLLSGLDQIEWTESLKEIQRNWIGRSEGANIHFPVKDKDLSIEVFTTRADTIFGATFMVLAPESELTRQLTTSGQKEAVENYLVATKKRTERERLADVNRISGIFSGSYAINPFTGLEIPIWISDYVLAGYGTGAIMAVPAHDSRDFKFARHFGLPVVQVVVMPGENPSDPETWSDSSDSKEGTLINSGFLNGKNVDDAISAMNKAVADKGIGQIRINYRLRDAIFSRQRYWGEPFPVYYRDGYPMTLPLEKLPLELPVVDTFLPTTEGEPPLGRAPNWATAEGYPFELSTMPGFAGSSAYYLRYMDPLNDQQMVSKEANEYWQDVDLYVGGTEHAVGHLIYARFWNKFLFDIGKVCRDEPFRKLINQGMIQGRSNFVYRIVNTNTYVSAGLKDEYETTPLHVDIALVDQDVLDIEAFKNWSPDNRDASFLLEEGHYHCGWAVEKMSKSMFNVVNPDDIIAHYGADTLRLYEMFLGPIEQSKPWDTHGIDGVFKFIRRLWRLYSNEINGWIVTDEEPDASELKVLHRTIRKIQDDIERFSMNTAVSSFMICVNELTDLKCHKKAILEPLLVLLAPFAPHTAEELWEKMGHISSISAASWPPLDESLLEEDAFEYPVSFNGKTRFKILLPIRIETEEVEKRIREYELTARYLEGKPIRKIIVVPRRIINVVI